MLIEQSMANHGVDGEVCSNRFDPPQRWRPNQILAIQKILTIQTNYWQSKPNTDNPNQILTIQTKY